MNQPSHDDLIRDQFTRQATVFNAAPPIADEAALSKIVAAARPGPEDTVLDVACGGGLVAMAFARQVRHATGIDLTAAMLDHARESAAQKGLSNVSWDHGDVTTLPYHDGTFSIVVTRFSFHHLIEPGTVLCEMARVCAPGGRIVVVDTCVGEDRRQAAAFNRMEKLRDPSHVRNLTLAEMKGLFAEIGLCDWRLDTFELRDTLANLLARSYPNPGDDAKIVEMFRASAKDGSLGIEVRIERDTIHYAYPVTILAAVRS